MDYQYVVPDNIKRIDCIIQFKKTDPKAVLPTKAHDSDNCFDLYSVRDITIPQSQFVPHSLTGVEIGSAIVPVGLEVAYITPGFGFVIRGRSGLGFKHGIVPHFGEIDQTYRGDLGVKLYNFTSKPYLIKGGDRIAQIKIEKVWETQVEFTEHKHETQRGESGFGSTGK